MWGLIVSVPDNCLSFYIGFISDRSYSNVNYDFIGHSLVYLHSIVYRVSEFDYVVFPKYFVLILSVSVP